MNLKYIGSFTELKELLSSIDGKWEEKIDVVNIILPENWTKKLQQIR